MRTHARTHISQNATFPSTNKSHCVPGATQIREKNAGTDTNGGSGGVVGRHGYQATHIAPLQQQQQQPHEHQADWRDITIVPQPAYGSGFSGSQHYRPSSGGGGGLLDQHLLHGSSASSSGSGLSSYGSTRQHVISHSPWNANGHQKMAYMMVNLRTAANYEVRVQARNVHGWNRLSSTFHFSTADFVGELRGADGVVSPCVCWGFVKYYDIPVSHFLDL